MIDDVFREFLQIDKNALDEELVRHPDLIFRVGEACAEAIAERDSLKEQLAVTDAELDAVVREELKDEKTTEAIVKNRIQVHPKHTAASDAYLNAKEKCDILAALREAFSAKGYALRELCQLYLANYYSQDSIKSEAPDAVVYKRRRQQLAEARERRE